MNDFKKNSRFGGPRGGDDRGERRGGGFGGNRGFKGGSFGPKSFGPKEMFQATCASCQKSCEVPFRPNGKKPVYCRECFAANGGPEASEGASNRFAPRRDFDRPAYKPEYKADFKPAFKAENKPAGDGAIKDLKAQIDAVSSKLDKLIQLMSDKASASKKEAQVIAPVSASVSTDVSEIAAPKKAAKKVLAKKKK